ncbi:MAG: hypothetical protein Q9182_003539 [Xanthomendoza sp. 2 TL-2023]
MESQSSAALPPHLLPPFRFDYSFLNKPDTAVPSSSTIPQTARKQNKYNTPAKQAARREILTNVKEDWTWPPSAHQLGTKFPRRRKSTQWRERERDTSPGLSPSPCPGQMPPYKFKSANAVAPTAPESPENKRRRLAENETEWNEGLRIFLERRDFWTGAETQPISVNQGDGEGPVDDTSESDPLTSHPGPLSTSASDTTLNTRPASPISTSTQSLATSMTSQPSSVLPSSRTSQSSEVLPASTQLSCSTPSPLTAQKDPSHPHDHAPTTPTTITVIPLPPPLLSPTDHPTLGPTPPSLYPTIYRKIVIQSLSPTLPLNLSHVVGALVQGWKDNGEWPPKATVNEGDAKGDKGVGRKESLRGRMRALKVEIEGGTGDGVVGRRVGRRVRRVLGGMSG